MGTTESDLMWPTPCVAIARNGCPSNSERLKRKVEQGWTIELHDMASSGMMNNENWPTPDCSDRRSKNSKQQGLSNKVLDCNNWRTPAACDGDGGVKTLLSIAGDHAPKIKLRDHVNHEISETSKKKLNPDWVEQLMGLPVGHTQLSEEAGKGENRIDRLRLLGNGVVPQTAEKAFRTLLSRIADV